MIPFVDLSLQHKQIYDELDQVIKQVINESSFIRGQYVDNFEMNLADYCNMRHAIGVSSGTHGIHLALQVLGIGKDDMVITVPNTFVGTIEPIWYLGAKTMFVDVDYDTGLMSIEHLKETISHKTKVILPVHLYGQNCDMKAIHDLAEDYDCFVVEDACQAVGNTVGRYSDATVFSFYPAKNLGCFGDGGAILCNDNHIAEKIRCLCDHGRNEKYYHMMKGFNYRLDSLQAAVLDVKLPYLKFWNNIRRDIARYYNRRLSFGKPVKIVDECNYHLYVLRVEHRDLLRKYLKENGVMTGVHYPVPLHFQPGYLDLGYGSGSFPVVERLAGEIISLPMFPFLHKDQPEFVVNLINSFELNGDIL